MGETEIKDLAADIKRNGLRDPIALYKGKILDGRNRRRACESASVEPTFVDLNDDVSPFAYVVSKNLHRRHLTPSQLSTIAAELMPMVQKEAKKRKAHGKTARGRTLPTETSGALEDSGINDIKGDARAIAGKMVGVGATIVQKAKTVMDKDPEEFDRIKRGETTTEDAYRKVTTGSDEKTERQKNIENATKGKMVKGISVVRGACMGLAEIDLSVVRHVCDTTELKEWAGIAKDLGRQLRQFGLRLENGGQK
jgi:hypothetical protein